jgi:mono/diheme cytochrome c family protein
MNTRRVFGIAASSIVAFLLQASAAYPPSGPATPTFYRDVLPILEKHCQNCHRPGEMAFPLMNYGQAAARAPAIRESVAAKKMPPWLADPAYGHFLNDPSLSQSEIKTLAMWADGGARPGNPREAPPPRRWTQGWNISPPDVVIEMPKPVALAPKGDIDYTYEIVPTHFREDRWVRMAELRPSSREHVHHAVVYIRPPGSKWLRDAPVGVPFTAESLSDKLGRRDTHWTDSDILLVYAPGSSPEIWTSGMAKFLPAGSDLVIQMHYMAMGHAASDRTGVGLVFAKQPPLQRVLTLQLTNDHFVIPPRAGDFRVEARGSLPNDATLLRFFPHMHWRGKKFEYNLVHPDGRIEPLLKVRWDFEWQLGYQLAEPLPLKAGTVLQAVAWYDNSSKNPHNPDPDQEVRWGEQTYEEMMVGFFDVAVAADLDKWKYFMRGNGGAPAR